MRRRSRKAPRIEVVDIAARWIAAGERLREIDPDRWCRILNVAEGIVAAHENVPDQTPVAYAGSRGAA